MPHQTNLSGSVINRCLARGHAHAIGGKRARTPTSTPEWPSGACMSRWARTGTPTLHRMSRARMERTIWGQTRGHGQRQAHARGHAQVLGLGVQTHPSHDRHSCTLEHICNCLAFGACAEPPETRRAACIALQSAHVSRVARQACSPWMAASCAAWNAADARKASPRASEGRARAA